MRTAVVLPVGSDSGLLRGCLDAIAAQTRPPDAVLVVDDSPGGQLVAPAGVTLLRSGGRGPYAARNIGWRALGGDVDLVLFLDTRSRPLPDWAARVVDQFAEPSVVLAGSEAVVRGGQSLGAQVAERHQVLRLERHVSNPFFRPYLPTCNLAIRRDELEAAGGFLETRSGADADLCWRVLDRPERRLATVPEMLMEWVPRDRVRDYLAQNHRYGRSNWALRRQWRAAGAPQRAPKSHAMLARRVAGVVLRAGLARATRRSDELVRELRKGGTLAFEAGYRAAVDHDRLRGGR